MKNNATKTAKKLGLVAVAMFGFGYLMVPIYNILCEVTGINGKTGRITQSQVNVITDFELAKSTSLCGPVIIECANMTIVADHGTEVSFDDGKGICFNIT